MTLLELLKQDAENAWNELQDSLKDVSETHAWAVLPNAGSDYLHSDGSIQGIALHVACGKWINGSICFRDTEIRWRDLRDQVAAFEPSWEAALEYLRRAYEYWMASWAELKDVEEIRPTGWRKDVPAWRIIQIITRHDSYHAGQIAVLRYANGESTEKPPSVAEDIQTHCRELAAW